MVGYMMQIMTAESLPQVSLIRDYLKRGQQEASRVSCNYLSILFNNSFKALWNFAYLESNRTLMSHDNGIEKLRKALAKATDPIIIKNITGILYMFKGIPTNAGNLSNNNSELGSANR